MTRYPPPSFACALDALRQGVDDTRRAETITAVTETEFDAYRDNRVMDCLACGPTSSPATREHVFAQWLLRELDSPSMSFYRRHGDGSTEPHRQPINLASFTLRRICEDCNNGWMGQLEEAAKPVIVPLMRGERQLGTLEEAERWTLARWVAKTAIVDSYAIGAECPIDLSVLRWMRRNLDDVPGRFAAAAFQVEVNFIGHMQNGVIRDLLAGGKAAGNITVIALPRVIFVCAFPMLPEPTYVCKCVPHGCWPLWPHYRAWKLLDGKVMTEGLGEMETMLQAAESIELFQPLTG